MGFTTATFLFGFLPITLLLYYVSPRPVKNGVLLTASLLFYAWGEVFYVAVIIASIVVNYHVGRFISRSRDNADAGRRSRLYLISGVVFNVGLLFSFKYANFVTDNLNVLLSLLSVPRVDLKPLHLPIGISFFTFQAISYIVDVYRKVVAAQQNIFSLALYISLFPELLAGPIIRYQHVAGQITGRSHSLGLFALGIQRFIYGMAKKMLIANPIGEIADSVFAITGNNLTVPLAWIGALAYTLQIYFDFSGYSDMAIGLGRMFGFRLRENFDYPYISSSVREFWRRWHISLSTWFRDYVYISLGGNQVSTPRVYGNLIIVFSLAGIWHGASWNFVIWGLFHGLFLASEHGGFSSILGKVWKPVRHVYVLLVVVIGWVFFRAENLSGAMMYLRSMADVTNCHTTPLQYAQVLTSEGVYAFLVGIVLSTPVYAWMEGRLGRFAEKCSMRMAFFIDLQRLALLTSLLLLSILKVASSTYNPFIYFRF